jgi:P27 family predicted phage terminase small subunit
VSIAMPGRKSKPDNVIPMTRGDKPAATSAVRRASVKQLVSRLRPRGMDPELRKEWDRVANLLADPTVDRLKPRFVDVITEYCRCMVRLRSLRTTMLTLQAEIYRVEGGRNGTQIKQHPFVASINEAWRQWRSMIAMLGLSPADERNLIPGHGDLFDEAEKYF